MTLFEQWMACPRGAGGVVFVALAVALAPRPAAAQCSENADGSFLCGTVSDLNGHIASAAPAAQIIIANGSYAETITLDGQGEAGAPIVVRAETPGQVLFTAGGASFTGSHQTLQGIRFEGGEQVIVFEGGDYNRLTDCLLLDIGADVGAIVIHGNDTQHNRIDHCTLDTPSPYGWGFKIRFKSHEAEGNTHNRIDHNHILNHEKLDPEVNVEAIQIGGGLYSFLFDAHSVIEFNKFYKCNANNELISIKTSSNVIRYNHVEDSGGHITVRGGEYNDLEGNIILANASKERSDGLRAHGRGNRIVNNYIATPHTFGIQLADGLMLPIEGTISALTANTLTDASADWSDVKPEDECGVWVSLAGGERKYYGIDQVDATTLTLEPGDDLVADGAQVGDACKVVCRYTPCSDCLAANNTVWHSSNAAVVTGGDDHGVQPVGAVILNNLTLSEMDDSNDRWGVFVEGPGALGQYTSNLALSTGTLPVWFSGDGAPQPAGILTGDPQLAFDGTIHRLQAASTAAIDQGTAADAIVDDIDGDPRTGSPDIGADELGGALVEIQVGHSWRDGGPETILMRDDGEGGAAGAPAATAPLADDDSGCGCRVGRGRRSRGWLVLGGGLLFASLRRRQSARRSTAHCRSADEACA